MDVAGGCADGILNGGLMGSGRRFPACASGFEPIEWLWRHLKGNAMAGFLNKDGKALNDKRH